jgi:hypothetical protein
MVIVPYYWGNTSLFDEIAPKLPEFQMGKNGYLFQYLYLKRLNDYRHPDETG